MNKKPQIKFKTKQEARHAYEEDLKKHREILSKIFDKFGNEFCNEMGANYELLESRIAAHDLTKLNEIDEYHGFMLYDYLSEEDNIEPHMIQFAYDKARLSHYHNNPHHPEFWVYIKDKWLIASQMDAESVCEMIMDWIAKGEVDGTTLKDAWDFARVNKAFHQNTFKDIDKLVDFYYSLI